MSSQPPENLPAVTGEIMIEDVREHPVFNAVLSASFEENAFTEEERSLYRSIFDRLVTEYSARPGLKTNHILICQRVAWLTMLVMKRERGARGDALFWADYDRLNRALRDFMDRLMAEAKLSDVEATFKREVFRASVHAFRDVVDQLPLSDAQRIHAGNIFADSLAERLASD